MFASSMIFLKVIVVAVSSPATPLKSTVLVVNAFPERETVEKSTNDPLLILYCHLFCIEFP